nr:immunoglobulin light chain junction region [Macaca mulatta]MOX77718.1 immunoglobulin light chain junction region [Macaca mulatta]MOX78096.1 immunoglobulin light chain junction region [Macaca mulatta]MOX78177.1 immunoglobulin light chain junction region [Macaca mulatta]MOX79349.1 immunoglobulin light chain junction region [Macaca mulatta]
DYYCQSHDTSQSACLF